MRPTASIVLGLLLSIGEVTAAPIISIQPSATTVNVGQSFSIEISVSDAVDLYAFQFDLGFNPGMLTATSVTEGSFLPSAGSTFFVPGAIDNTAGTVTFTADSLLTAVSGANGAGTLASLSFTGAAAGTSALNLFNVVLLDSQLAGITNTTQSGSVTVSQATTIPEPGTLILLSASAMFLSMSRRKRM